MKRIKAILILFVVMLLCVVSAVACNCGCSGSCNRGEKENDGEKKVVITNKITSMLRGDEYALTVKTENVKGVLTFTSSDDGVAEISGEGVIIAKSAGNAKITASCDGASDSFSVSVTDDVEPRIDSGESGTVYMFIGGKYRPSPQITYNGSTAENVKFSYSLSDGGEEIATVSENGEITALKEGECEIIVSAEYRFRKLSASFKVCVTKKTYVSLDKTRLGLATYEIGGKVTSAKLNAVVVKDGVTQNAEISWSTENPSVATVDAEGRVTAGKNTGSTTITARVADDDAYYASCTVTVEKPLVKTGLAFDTELDKPLSLPAYEIADFTTENVISVTYKGKEILGENGEPQNTLIVGSPQAKELIVETEKLYYSVESTVINAVIRERADIDGLIGRLSRFERENDAERYGYYYDGYVVFDADIDFEGGEFGGVVTYAHMKPTVSGSINFSANGFNGVIDGKGHKISNAYIKTGFVGHLNKGTLKNLSFENVTSITTGSAVVVNSIGAGTVENVTVKGKIETPSVVPKYLSMGLICSIVKNSSARFKNLVVEVTDDIIQPTNNLDKNGEPVSREVAGVFGRMESKYSNNPLFENCCVIGNSPVLFGEGKSEDGVGYELFYKQNGISVFENYDEYYISVNGYTFDAENPQNRDADCTHKSVKIYVKEGAADYVVTTPALGHSWTGEGANKTCERCGATFATIFAETDVRTGYDFSTIDTSKTIASVFYGVTELSLNNNAITFEKTDVLESDREYTVNYTDGSVCTVKLTLWSLLIKNEADLRLMNSYAVQKPWDVYSDSEVPSSENMRIYGRYKLVNDIIFADASEWNQSDAPDYYESANEGKGYVIFATCGFHGTFDGNGKTIENFRTSGTNHSGFINILGTNGIVKNVTFKNVYYRMGGYSTGIIAGYANGGTIENVKINGVKLLSNPALAGGRGVGLLVGSVGTWLATNNPTYGRWLTGLNVKNVTVDVIGKNDFGSAIAKEYFHALGEASLNGNKNSYTGFDDPEWIEKREGAQAVVFPLICENVTINGISTIYGVRPKSGVDYIVYGQIKGVNGATQNVIAPAS